MIGISKNVEQIFRLISDENKENINYFYSDCLTRNYRTLSSDLITEVFDTKILSYEDNDLLLNYSGFNYKHINAALRDNWNYEVNGNINNKEEYRKLGYSISEVIRNNPTILTDNIIVYRGVDLSYFKEYGITTLEDLLMLNGNWLLDKALVSTSLNEKSSFFKKENELGLNYNIKIEYMIPEEFQDGIYLNNGNTYNPEQQEFLINSSNISKVSSVLINDDNTATIKSILIPKEIYDDYYKQNSFMNK